MKPSSRGRSRPDLPAAPTERLRACILRRQAGEWLTQKDLLAELKDMPLRQLRRSLAELKQEGLIEIFERVGIQVKALTSREINSRMGLRRAVEVEVTLALARTTRTSEKNFLAPLRAVHQQMDQVAAQVRTAGISRKDSDDFLALDERFHTVICDLAGYEEAKPILMQIRNRLKLMAAVPLQTPEQFQAVIEEHAAILKAVSEGTAEQVQAAVETHLQRVLERWFPALESRSSRGPDLPPVRP